MRYASGVFTKLLKDTPLKPNVKMVLDELSKDNKIYFITARFDSCYLNAYEFSKEYLDRYSIPYTDIIANVEAKGEVCKKLGIDLFIDDGRNNCENVSKYGIDVLLFENYYNCDETRFDKVKNWDEVLSIVKEKKCKKNCLKITN